MKQLNGYTRALLMAILFCGAATNLLAGGEKERMIQRAPQIKQLKTQGTIGEKADGYLDMVKTNSAAKAVVDAENKDRKSVYTAIADGQKVAVEAVATRRALQLKQQAKKGEWLKGTDGKWKQK